MALTRKQRVFIDEYLKCWNASEAARRAGYSVDTAGSQGNRLLKNAEISAEIDARVKSSAMSANEVLQRLSDFGRADMTDFLDLPEDPDGKLPSFNFARAIRTGKGHLIKKLKYKEDGIEFEMIDTLAALALLVKIHGMAKETLEITGQDGADIPIRVVDYRHGLTAVTPRPDDDS